ncbi:protein FAM170A-like isoform X2 [Ochotona princeps]|uniref:protein FAM170A-like isoform X2 n=1 Tax=Ochotona princeps TaxID=9978 RepID=UPI0027151549|nr:protein FAM170A-like isoform X2 [Ochotona princeps]
MKQKRKMQHLENTYSTQTEKTSRGASQSLEEKIQLHEGKETSSESEYYTCQSTLRKLPSTEPWKSQVTFPETSTAVPACSQAERDSFSSSEYFSCVSSPSKNLLADEDGIQRFKQKYCICSSELPLQMFTPYQRNCFHYHLANEPCTPEIHRRKEREMKVYYMHVPSKREMAGLNNASQPLVPPPRQQQVQEMVFPGKIPIETNLPIMSAWELLTESECCWDVEEHKEKVGVREQSMARHPPLEESPTARPPKWLLSPESGYKCLGCCRVFPSKDALQWHVQHGVEEGFSCRAFHLAFAWLKSKSMKEKKNWGNKKVRKITCGSKIAKESWHKWIRHLWSQIHQLFPYIKGNFDVKSKHLRATCGATMGIQRLEGPVGAQPRQWLWEQRRPALGGLGTPREAV